MIEKICYIKAIRNRDLLANIRRNGGVTLLRIRKKLMSYKRHKVQITEFILCNDKKSNV